MWVYVNSYKIYEFYNIHTYVYVEKIFRPI